ncbi:thiamine-phosphate kinase [Paramicrobacterium fandaimingii]|uniref:thiamine-phosphate kinase n=1 Tax=Paramicrobacterium fandaimingii TaxID=2708079 RepID=UPI00141FBD49|nr:thiamine-phosphate kinase [Microbacterium fandaimingii]
MGFTDSADGQSVADATEGAVLARIVPRLPAAEAAIVGPGDDCAVMSAPDSRFVVTTDMMVHGPDFRQAWSTPWQLGWKAAATNLSDVAAMGARPTGLVVALAVPESTPVRVLEEFSDGLRSACESLAPGCGVVGGDLSVSATFTIAVTAFGDLEGRRPVMRSGARPGDVVAVSGRLGAASRGLDLLFSHGVDATGAPDASRAQSVAEQHPHLVGAQLTPQPPIGDGPLAADAGATAMMDISDGLALDASRLARASQVTLAFESLLLGDDVDAALHGGEDHGLLACFSPGTQMPGGFERIGMVGERGADDVTCDGDVVAATGWDPYTAWDGAVG